MPSDEQALIELEERISARAAELKVYRELMRDRIYVNADGSITTSQERLCRLMAENDRLTALLAERDAEIALLVAERDDLQSQSDRLEDDVLYLMRRASALRSGLDSIYARMARSRINDDSVAPMTFGALSDLLADDDAALAARGGEVQG